MERGADELGEILRGLAIHPPKLEDAGLEDCALPPESIIEAFSRAANSLKSRVFNPRSDDEFDGDCVQDPGPTNGQIPDALVGDGDGGISAPACGCNITAGRDEGIEGDKVVVVGVGGWEAGSVSDRVLVLGGDEKGGQRGCCPSIEEKKEVDVEVEGEDGYDEDNDDKNPILVEDLI